MPVGGRESACDQCGDQCLAFVVMQVEDGDSGAFLGQPLHAGATDALCAARHDAGLAIHTIHAAPPDALPKSMTPAHGIPP